MKSKGFTLIELMIVVSIIAILASVSIPSFIKFQCRSIGINAGLDKKLTSQLCKSCDTCAVHGISGTEALQNIADNRATFSTYLYKIDKETITLDDTPLPTLEPVPTDTTTRVEELEETVQKLRVKVLEESLRKMEQQEKELQKVKTNDKSWRE